MDGRPRLCVTLVAVVLATTSCGGGAASSNDAATTLPACARAGTAIELPDEMPADFPLPAGTRITSARRPFPGQVVVDGVVPLDLGAARAFFTERLPRAGYRVGRGDSEAGEVEALFTGDGVRGGWRVRRLPDCPALTLTLVFIGLG